MTNQEIIERFKSDKVKASLDIAGGVFVQTDLAHEIVKALRSQPCEDAISRQAVLDGLASIAKAKAKSDAQKSLMGRVMFFTEHLPSVTPQPKTGYWVGIDEEPHEVYECSRCGRVVSTFTANIEPHIEYKFCPNCGAKMVESQAESEGEE